MQRITITAFASNQTVVASCEYVGNLWDANVILKSFQGICYDNMDVFHIDLSIEKHWQEEKATAPVIITEKQSSELHDILMRAGNGKMQP